VASGAELGGLEERAHDGPGMAVEVGEDFGVGTGPGMGAPASSTNTAGTPMT